MAMCQLGLLALSNRCVSGRIDGTVGSMVLIKSLQCLNQRSANQALQKWRPARNR